MASTTCYHTSHGTCHRSKYRGGWINPLRLKPQTAKSFQSFNLLIACEGCPPAPLAAGNLGI